MDLGMVTLGSTDLGSCLPPCWHCIGVCGVCPIRAPFRREAHTTMSGDSQSPITTSND